MKKIILIIGAILITNMVEAKTVRVVYKADGTISVIHAAKEDNATKAFKKTMEEIAELKGMPYEDIDNSQLPQDRADRQYWTGKKGEGVKIDNVKKNADIAAKQAKKDAVKQKLKLTDAELIELKELLKGD